MSNRPTHSNPPMVSIIIPVFNKCDLTIQCLEAIPGVTTRVPHEIIVVDNASSDGTPQRLAELQRPNLRVIRNEVNRGFAGACNQGAAAATGKYWLFLNNDTIPVHGWLEALVEEMRTHPHVAAVGAKLIYESSLVQHAGVAFARETRSPFHPHRLLRMDDPRVNVRRELQAVTAACVLIRPKWFQDCGGFKEEYRNGYEDLDLCLEIRKRGGVIVYQPKSVVIHLESQTPGRMKFDNENRALFFRRWENAILSDEDAYYFEGGLRSLGRSQLQQEEPRLARFASDSERLQWEVVAQVQSAAAAGRLAEVKQALGETQRWPADAGVRRWAGALCLHLGCAELAKPHIEAAITGCDDPSLRAQWDLTPRAGTSPARWEAMARAGFKALRNGDHAAAQTALETALLRGAPARLILPAWQRASQNAGNPEAQLTRAALQALPRLDKFTAQFLAETQSVPQPAAAPTKPSQPTPQLASIIILALNQIEHTRKCVDSLLAHTRSPFEVILVDNGSTDGTAAYFAELQRTHAHFKIITNPTNRGFAGGNNQGLAVAQGELLVLLNNDTIVTPGWLEGFQAILDADATVGLVGPVSNRVSGPQLVAVDYSAEAGIAAFARAWSTQHAGTVQLANRLVGFCLAFRRSVLDAVGALDEQFGSGNFEDDDYCIRARLAGFSSRIARGVFIHHTGSQTFKGAKIDYRAAMTRNWDYFRGKWQFGAEASLERGYPMPTCKPDGVTLHLPLPAPGATPVLKSEPASVVTAPSAPPQPRPIEIPAVAQLGNLDGAKALFGRRELAGAWESAGQAIQSRPFHPEGCLLLAEIALAAGAGPEAKRCAERARQFAPNWKAPKQFLQKNLKGASAPDWLKLPADWDKSAPGRPRLSVCVLTRNEEKFIGQCLASVQGLADQLVVLDTGSTDRTVEIARGHGATVQTFPWCDDFSAARNAALAHLTGDWILMLDADEELPADQHAALRQDLSQQDAIAYRVPLMNHGEAAQGRSFIPRLFRNVPGAHYYGRIHEQVFPSLIPFCKSWGLETKLGNAQLVHHGYSKEIVRDRNKVERNLSLLRLALAENPSDANLQMNMGLELVRSGEINPGLTHYREAFRLMSAQAPANVVPELREVLLTQFTSHLYRVRGHDEVVSVLNSSLAKNGGLTASLHFALGLAHYELGQPKEAAAQMKSCLAKRHDPGLSPINTDILTAAPSHCLALSLAKLNDAAGAETAFQAALKDPGKTEDVKLDYARLLVALERPLEALHLINEVVAAAPQHLAAWRLGGDLALSQPAFLEFALDWTGEALRLLPEDASLQSLRAEALLFSGNSGEAFKILSNLKEASPKSKATAILTGMALGHPTLRPGDAKEEIAISRAFMDCYRRLVHAGVHAVIAQLNSRVPALRAVLPSAAGILDAVLAEAEKPDALATA